MMDFQYGGLKDDYCLLVMKPYQYMSNNKGKK